MWTWCDDARAAVRAMRCQPAFALVVAATLAWGLGANLAIFSLFNALLLRPWEVDGRDRVVLLQTATPQGTFSGGSPAKFAYWQMTTGSFIEELSAYRATLARYGETQQGETLRIFQVSANYFRLFRGRLLHGRTFSPAEDSPSGGQSVVISHGLWTRLFNQDAGAIGRSLMLGGESFVVIGVLAPGFDDGIMGPPVDAWVPFQLDPASRDQGHYFQVAGRLRRAVSLPEARIRLLLLGGEYSRRFPTVLPPRSGSGFSAELLRDVVVGDARRTLLLLWTAVAFMFLLVCANVSALTVVRVSTRRRDLAVRSVLGAQRSRLVRSLVVESSALALLGGAAALIVGWLLVRIVVLAFPDGLHAVALQAGASTVDWRVVAFAVLLSAAASGACGVMPALQATGGSLEGSLRDGGPSTTFGLRHRRIRRALVVVQLAIAVVLLASALLVGRTVRSLQQLDLGFSRDHVLTMRTSFNDRRYRSAESVMTAFGLAGEALHRAPEVQAVAAACCLPLEGVYSVSFSIVGRPLTLVPYHGVSGWVSVTPGYFEVLRVAILRGREFTERDRLGATPVVLINEAMARQFWPDRNPLGERVLIGRGVIPEFDTEPEREIVGVVADMRDSGAAQLPGPRLYVPQAQVSDAINATNVRMMPMAWLIRTRTPPDSAGRSLAEILSKATTLAVTDVQSMDGVFARTISRERFSLFLLTLFGLAALVLSAVSVFGLIAYSVQQRAKELAIRMVLGARFQDIRSMLLLEFGRIIVPGILAGMLGTVLLARVLAATVLGIPALDAVALMVPAGVLGATAAVAAWLPIRHLKGQAPSQVLMRE